MGVDFAVGEHVEADALRYPQRCPKSALCALLNGLMPTPIAWPYCHAKSVDTNVRGQRTVLRIIVDGMNLVCFLTVGRR